MQPRFSVDLLRRVAVLGAGTMGHGIAHVAAACGHQVALYDAAPGGAAAGRVKVERTLAKGVELGKVRAEDRDGALARLHVASTLAEACAGADLVIEAVPERLEL
ncbi:MAG: 3-hydroxybutyryl-CoA dehydrogenase, partial [Kofleriaceae bacterium]|nr:3-hydroxybutyryl-CoA dehydrogenase [Kofleriaceae bacterium]